MKIMPMSKEGLTLFRIDELMPVLNGNSDRQMVSKDYHDAALLLNEYKEWLLKQAEFARLYARLMEIGHE